MPAAVAVPIIMGAVTTAASYAINKSEANTLYKRQKEMYDQQRNPFGLSDEQRQAIMAQLLGSLHLPGMPGVGAQAGNMFQMPGMDGGSSYMGNVSPAYQGWLQSVQERRDARSGVPLVPPQGAASPSAQRQSAPQGSRSY